MTDNPQKLVHLNRYMHTRLELSRTRQQQLIRSGELMAAKIGRHWFAEKGHLDAFIERHRRAVAGLPPYGSELDAQEQKDTVGAD